MSPLFSKRGFTLVELSIVIVIIALIVGTGLSIGSSAIESAKRVATQNRLDAIEAALMGYRLANNRLPCPGDVTLAESNANFGVEAATPGTCKGGTPAANFQGHTGSVIGVYVVEGSVPVKALNLPAEFMYDGWGRRIVYAVWANATSTNAFLSYGIQQMCSGITVNNAGGAARTTQGLYSLISHGPNGHGGYNDKGTRISSSSANTDEQTNCHCNASAVNTTYGGTYVQKNADTAFDDIVRYKERWQLQNVYDGYHPAGSQTCPAPGFRVDGVNNNDNSGNSVASGDVNGDGIDDLIIGASSVPGGANKGAVYVVFGTRRGFPNPLPLSSLDGNNGFKLNGENNNDFAGSSVASGDVNGDTKADVIIGAPSNSSKGAVYVVFGHSDPDHSYWTTNGGVFTLDNDVTHGVIDGTKGFKLNGENNNVQAGFSVASGDVGGDSKADVIIGALGPSPTFKGAVYVVFGRNDWTDNSGVFTLDNDVTHGVIDGTTGFKLIGENDNDRAGWSVASGDVGGDSKADVIIGALFAPSGDLKGTVYVVFGKSSGWSASQTLDSTFLNGGGIAENGFKLNGENAGDYVGYSVASGNVNGDGKADVIIGALGPSPTFKGAVYVVFGKTSDWAVSTNLSSLDGTTGFKLIGENDGDQTGRSVASGDVNGDGKSDIIVGANTAPSGTSYKGAVYVVFGKSDPDHSYWTTNGGVFTLDNHVTHGVIDGTKGFKFNGENDNDYAGTSVASGDVNGDGKPDVIVGALGAPSGTYKGRTYIYFGQGKTTWTNPFDLGDLCTGVGC